MEGDWLLPNDRSHQQHSNSTSEEAQQASMHTLSSHRRGASTFSILQKAVKGKRYPSTSTVTLDWLAGIEIQFSAPLDLLSTVTAALR